MLNRLHAVIRLLGCSYLLIRGVTCHKQLFPNSGSGKNALRVSTKNLSANVSTYVARNESQKRPKRGSASAVTRYRPRRSVGLSATALFAALAIYCLYWTESAEEKWYKKQRDRDWGADWEQKLRKEIAQVEELLSLFLHISKQTTKQLNQKVERLIQQEAYEETQVFWQQMADVAQQQVFEWRRLRWVMRRSKLRALCLVKWTHQGLYKRLEAVKEGLEGLDKNFQRNQRALDPVFQQEVVRYKASTQALKKRMRQMRQWTIEQTTPLNRQVANLVVSYEAQ